MVEREGLHMLQAVFVEEVCLCCTLLLEEGKFSEWAEKLMEFGQKAESGVGGGGKEVVGESPEE